MSEPEEHFSLVMPFVLTKSEGGPFDDESFVMGCVVGGLITEIDALPLCATGYARYVQAAVLPQMDLVAMKYGFVMSSEPWSEDAYWAWMTLTRPEADS